MISIIGLGNPGREYENTRHNAGFMFVDNLSSLGFVLNEKPNIQIFKGSIAGQQVALLKPQTYMNNSGIPVSQFVNFFKIPLDKVFVFYDDIDVVVGKVKHRFGGGNGGHNGIKSLDGTIGKNYHRIRIGVGRPSDKTDVSDYVLQKFRPNEQFEIEMIIKKMVENIDKIITDPVHAISLLNNDRL